MLVEQLRKHIDQLSQHDAERRRFLSVYNGKAGGSLGQDLLPPSHPRRPLLVTSLPQRKRLLLCLHRWAPNPRSPGGTPGSELTGLFRSGASLSCTETPHPCSVATRSPRPPPWTVWLSTISARVVKTEWVLLNSVLHIVHANIGL